MLYELNDPTGSRQCRTVNCDSPRPPSMLPMPTKRSRLASGNPCSWKSYTFFFSSPAISVASRPTPPQVLDRLLTRVEKRIDSLKRVGPPGWKRRSVGLVERNYLLRARPHLEKMNRAKFRVLECSILDSR